MKNRFEFLFLMDQAYLNQIDLLTFTGKLEHILSIFRNSNVDFNLKLSIPNFNIQCNSIYANTINEYLFDFKKQNFENFSATRAKILNKIKKMVELEKYLVDLITLGIIQNADGIIVSNNKVLEKIKPSLYREFNCKLLSIDEFKKIVNSFSGASGVYIAFDSSLLVSNFSVFYTCENEQAYKLIKYYQSVEQKILKNKILNSYFHNFVYQRYSFISYSLDLVYYYWHKNDFVKRRDIDIQSFSMELGYSLNNFFFYVWGMLDQLTVIFKEIYKLEIDKKECGINKPNFLKELKFQDKELHEYLVKHEIKQWIEKIALIRHSIGHNSVKIPTKILLKKEEVKTDSEILEIIENTNYQEYCETKKVFEGFDREAGLEIIENELIHSWRIDDMDVLHPNIIMLDDNKKMLDPLYNIRGDMVRVDEVVDCLIKSFSKKLSKN